MCVTVSGYTLKWASTSETRSKWYAMKGATVAKTMQYRFQITNMTELRERESTGGSSFSGKEGLKRCPSLPFFLSFPPYPSPTYVKSFPSLLHIPPFYYFLSISSLLSIPLSLQLIKCLFLSYLILPYLTLPYLTLPYLTLPYLTLPYLTLPHLTV